jgi:glucan phosphoethanolaminetransferase (alkaline phosphatase superfamily)
MENIGLIITSAVCGLIALLCFFISYRQYKEKGIIFNNVWLYASQKEKDNMDVRFKKHLYLVSRNVFLGIAVLFIVIPITIHVETSWMRHFGYALISLIMTFLCIYAIAQHIAGEKEKTGTRRDDF